MVEHGHNFLFCLTFFWSVAVEEQFYIGWALLLKINLRLVFLASIFLIILSLVFRFAYRSDDPMLSFHTFSALGNFGWGALLAHMAFYKSKILKVWQDFPRAIRIIPWALLLISAWGYPYFFSSGLPLVLERSWFALLFVFVLADWIGSKAPAVNLEGRKGLGFWGRRSFGLYVWHGVVLMAYSALSRRFGLQGMLAWVMVIGPAICLAATFALAALSYRWFEARFLVLKDRFA
jgi:peptidoglycan/LPS O-acetylase OafA/YrhL